MMTIMVLLLAYSVLMVFMFVICCTQNGGFERGPRRHNETFESFHKKVTEATKRPRPVKQFDGKFQRFLDAGYRADYAREMVQRMHETPAETEARYSRQTCHEIPLGARTTAIPQRSNLYCPDCGKQTLLVRDGPSPDWHLKPHGTIIRCSSCRFESPVAKFNKDRRLQPTGYRAIKT